jgi:hypothetical protein
LLEYSHVDILPQIAQIHAEKRQVGQMDLLKQMPQIRLIKTVATRRGGILEGSHSGINPNIRHRSREEILRELIDEGYQVGM